MIGKPGNLYQFIGLHSLLIGLFPFYIPVYLWKTGSSLAGISFFISLTGLGFCITLWIWDRLRQTINLKGIVLISFALEILLLAIVFGNQNTFTFSILALVNGAYSALFWTTQRVLFFNTIQPSNSGEKFGNLQIIVALFLKSGIFIGGLMLDKLGYTSVFLFSSLIASLGALSFFFSGKTTQLPEELVQLKAIGFSRILNFKDKNHSRPVFILDGIFLYLESYFWMISMFLIVKESFWELGILVIGLMVLFTILFFIIKNTIDRLPATLFFRVSIFLYAISWLLRGIISQDQNLYWLFIMLVFISFFTTLFRLTFNKRFFDQANTSLRYEYLIQKSYYSQATIAVSFALIGAITFFHETSHSSLQTIYFIAALLACGYTVYGMKKSKKSFPDQLIKGLPEVSPTSSNSAAL